MRDQFKELIKIRGLSLREIERRSKGELHASQLSRWLNQAVDRGNDRPAGMRDDQLVKLAKILGCEIELHQIEPRK